MYSLIRFFLQLSLLRRRPQELPQSVFLLVAVLLADLLVGGLGSAAYFDGLMRSLLANAVHIVIFGMLLLGTLSYYRFPFRFVQTASAVLGVNVLVGVLFMASDLVLGQFLGLKVLAAFINLGLLAWVHLAVGHILRHSYEVELWIGILLAIGYSVVGAILVNTLVPPVMPVVN